MIKFQLKVAIILIIGIIFSCKKNNSNDCCTFLSIEGEWNLSTYWHELENGERELYTNNNTEAITPNFYPNLITGKIIFNADQTFIEDFHIVLIRDSMTLDTITSNLTGEYKETIIDGNCDYTFNRGEIIFNTNSETIYSNIVKQCNIEVSSTTPLIFRKRVGSDSLTIHLKR